ncbi:SDR family oxidoreductase [Arvimicrobium flavum]|uniref:SDR family oxidoreductase n=1 Tax=Arvimicrobium flavum TaxID=3393320 RepID=UPI00237ABDCB|nr:SDR family oxidoreductase [Mesorhizobium shangrilense]
MNIFIFGAGYSARAFTESNRGRAESIAGTTRSSHKFDILEASGVSPLLFDGATLGADLASALREATHLVVVIAPGDAGDPVLRLIPDLRAAMPGLEWIGYLSTVGVYGDHQGKWVDETSPCRPVSRRSVERLEAENAWTAAGRAAGVPVALLRLSGIYGPGRNAFVNLAAGTAKRLIKPGQVFNRIHVDDIAGALWHLAEAKLGGAFNVTDDLPAPPQDVVAYAAELMGVPPPPEQPFETADLSPMARSFYGENKRVSNAAIKKAGYAFQFPDYRAALAAMWRGDGWNASDARPVRSPIRA